MPDLYDKLSATAERMIEKYGRSVALVSITKSGTDYDPIITETSVNAKMVESRFTSNEVDGTLILSSDKKFIVGSSSNLSIDMKISDNGKKYSIVNIMETRPGSTLILSKIQARL